MKSCLGRNTEQREGESYYKEETVRQETAKRKILTDPEEPCGNPSC